MEKRPDCRRRKKESQRAKGTKCHVKCLSRLGSSKYMSLLWCVIREKKQKKTALSQSVCYIISFGRHKHTTKLCAVEEQTPRSQYIHTPSTIYNIVDIITIILYFAYRLFSLLYTHREECTVHTVLYRIKGFVYIQLSVFNAVVIVCRFSSSSYIAIRLFHLYSVCCVPVYNKHTKLESSSLTCITL